MFDNPPLVVGTGGSAGCPYCSYSVPYITGDEWEPVRTRIIQHIQDGCTGLLAHLRT